MAEVAFSEDGKYFSAIATDGRLKIWDTETNELKQQYTPDLHLTSPPSCLHWITVTLSMPQTPKQKKKRASISANETQCIALGTHSGKILLYSVAQAKIETILAGHTFSKVTALDWNRKYGLYSCSKDDTVTEWDIQSGKPRNQYEIAETEAHYLVAASWQVRLWRLYKGRASIVKTLGHNASQTALLSLARTALLSLAKFNDINERLLSFWDITITEDHTPITNGDEPTPNKRQKNRKKSLTSVPIVHTPTYNFVLEDAPRIVDADLKEDEGMPSSQKQNDTNKVRSDKGAHVQLVEPLGGVASRKRMVPGGQVGLA
ncbi:WD-repeat protein [Operophtera brumata]|uniref:WD-repeat protein n=1 Tax=Operophtera brumata TaxID=104452 RepID=A0A0L7KT20_OPEBR|nr:WD-repeat protein [Operophtera brumata]